jgi:hypothetical protein
MGGASFGNMMSALGDETKEVGEKFQIFSCCSIYGFVWMNGQQGFSLERRKAKKSGDITARPAPDGFSGDDGLTNIA